MIKLFKRLKKLFINDTSLSQQPQPFLATETSPLVSCIFYNDITLMDKMMPLTEVDSISIYPTSYISSSLTRLYPMSLSTTHTSMALLIRKTTVRLPGLDK